MERMYAWHYTRRDILAKIQSSGLLKSRNLLLSEKLRARPDWDKIRHDPQAIKALLPADMGRAYSFMSGAPVINFSLEQHWDSQAGELNESKYDGALDERERSPVLTMSETERLGGGLARLGISPAKLVSWSRMQFAAGYTWPLIAAMHLWDRAIGSPNIEHVRCFVGAAMPLSQIERIEMFQDGVWVPAVLGTQRAAH
jgi:hypothetical protein